MKTLTSILRRSLRTGLLAAGVTAVIGGAALAPAFADGDDWHRGGEAREPAWDHGRRDDDRFERRPEVYVAPGYYPAPGYGYSYAPAPAYPVPGLNLVFR
jgi:hypothetical protein